MFGFEAPVTVRVAAAVAVVQGVALLVLTGLELAALSTQRLVMGLTTAGFFALAGVVLLGCAWGLAQGRIWARGPILMAQLVQLGVAWSFRGATTAVVAGVLAVIAVVGLVAIAHPATSRALDPDGAAAGPDQD